MLLVFEVFDVGEGTSVPTLWFLYQFQNQKNAPSVTVPMDSGEGGTCARFGGFHKIADILGLLCNLLAKEENKLYVERCSAGVAVLVDVAEPIMHIMFINSWSFGRREIRTWACSYMLLRTETCMLSL